MTLATDHLKIIKERDEYGTPEDLYKDGIKLAGFAPCLDVCATELNSKCINFYSKEDDALTREWKVNFFMNPPYSQVADFVGYAYEQHRKHKVNGLALVYAKTDTKWFHEYIYGKAEIHFIKGRVKFLDQNNNKTKNASPYPSMWVVWRAKPKVITGDFDFYWNTWVKKNDFGDS